MRGEGEETGEALSQNKMADDDATDDDLDMDVDGEGDDDDNDEPEEVEEPVPVSGFQLISNGLPWTELTTVPLKNTTIFIEYPPCVNQHRSRRKVVPADRDPYVAAWEAQGNERPMLRFKVR